MGRWQLGKQGIVSSVRRKPEFYRAIVRSDMFAEERDVSMGRVMFVR